MLFPVVTTITFLLSHHKSQSTAGCQCWRPSPCV